MTDFNQDILNLYGNKLRVRVCGFCFIDNKLLLVKHHNLGDKGILWAPPGGGVNFGESLKDSLTREFKEETGLEIAVGDFLFINEFLAPPASCNRAFFEVRVIGGSLQLGTDPEMSPDRQLLHDFKLFSFDEIAKLNPDTVHGVLKKFGSWADIKNTGGFLK